MKDLIPGGLASGRSPSEFDAKALRRGTRVEMEHTNDRRIAREIAMDHLAEDPDHYEKLPLIENPSAARVMRETFHWSKSRKVIRLHHDWPSRMLHVGDSLSVSYSSDKGEKSGDFRPWKHIAESHNRALVVPRFFHQYEKPSSRTRFFGKWVNLSTVPLPRHFARLALFEECYLRLFKKGMTLGTGNDGVVQITARHGWLGGAIVPWEDGPQPFLFVYTESDGVILLIVGDELGIERDGIVG